MAKKEVRIVQASEDIKAMVDKGADIDIEMKNLTFEDKACKQGITDFVENNASEDDSVQIEGERAIALVSKAEKLEICAGAETFPEMVKAAKQGLLDDVVKMKKSLVVPVADIDRAAEILNEAGVGASVVEDFGVTAAAMRKHKERKMASEDVEKATDALEGCLDVSHSYRVKYQVKGG